MFFHAYVDKFSCSGEALFLYYVAHKIVLLKKNLER